MQLPRRAAYAFAAIGLIGLGLLTRWPYLGLSGVVAKYAGSMLWGAMVYCVVGFCLPHYRCLRIAMVAAVIAAGVEFSQLWHTDWLDGFRRTRIGALLIGRYFSWADILAYWIGIAAAAIGARYAAPRRARPRPEEPCEAA